MASLPKTQRAVQLVGPDELIFNDSKKVPDVGDYQMLCKVEVVGLCFSDLKLLKQFSNHPRKSEVISGIDKEILEDLPSYVPGELPAVPGHEAVVTVIKAGDKVANHKQGGRYLVQADFRWIKTKSSNGAFGYNFEGALQEYVLVDERVITAPDGQSMFIEVSNDLPASAAALVEPWACVEDAYASSERVTIKAGGNMLVVGNAFDSKLLNDFIVEFGKPASVTLVSDSQQLETDVAVEKVSDLSSLAQDDSFDDVIYFGSDAAVIESLVQRVANHGLLNIVLCGGEIGREVSMAIGRVHYGNIRITGTVGCDLAQAMRNIPETDEIRPGDKINVVGAGGPMGLMHVVRNVCQGVDGIVVYAGDVSDERLEALTKIVKPLAEKNNVDYRPYNAAKANPEEKFDYISLMAPVGQLVSQAVKSCNANGLINIFAGIPVNVIADIDLDVYIAEKLYFIGTSGSTLEDMKLVLKKVKSKKLDTNVSVAAVAGLGAAVEGIRAVENRSIAGKIIVYPACKNLKLIKLEDLQNDFPQIAEKLDSGLWTLQAEKELLAFP